MEERYTQIEKEALAFTWACERFSDFLVGIEFAIQTDHKLLVPLFSTKNLDKLPVWVQRFQIRMLRFSFTISRVPGKQLVIADALSRAPSRTADDQDLLLQRDASCSVNTVVESLPASEQRLYEIEQEQKKDSVYTELRKFCQEGWPDKKSLSSSLKGYHELASEISVVNGLLMRNSRIIIPMSLRKQVLEQIHTDHQGLKKCRDRARQSFWWPGPSIDMKSMIDNCRVCREFVRQRAEPLITTQFPELLWQKLGMDLFVYNKSTYLLVVDYYSHYIGIVKLTKLNAAEVIIHCKSIFARHGIPEEVVSDHNFRQSCFPNLFAITNSIIPPAVHTTQLITEKPKE